MPRPTGWINYFYRKSDKRFYPQLLRAKLNGTGGESALHTKPWCFVSGLHWNIRDSSPITIQMAKYRLVVAVLTSYGLSYFAHPRHFVEQTAQIYSKPIWKFAQICLPPKSSWRIWHSFPAYVGQQLILQCQVSFTSLRPTAHEHP